MTEQDLKKVLKSPAPTPRQAAREAALSAAMAAFDDQNALDGNATDINARTQSGRNSSKELQRGARLSSNRNLLERKYSMRALSKYAVAASVAAVAVGGPAAYYFSRQSTFYFSPQGSERDNVVGQYGFSGGRPDQDLQGNETKVSGAANEPAPGQPSPATTATRGPAVLKPEIARLQPRESTSRQLAQTEKITPPASGRLKKLGEFYNYNGGARGPADGLGAVGGGGGWTRSWGGSPRVAKSDNTKQYRTSEDRIIRHGFQGWFDGAVPRDKFETVKPNAIKDVKSEPVSTFSLDVDTASYAFVRRALMSGRLPPKNAVRVEELINYFNYDYQPPETPEEPFKVKVNVIPPPWSEVNRLVHVSIKGYELQNVERPQANLVFLIDVSGSMRSNDKLPLVKSALRMLVDELKPDDTIGIVTYASGTAVALTPTKVSEKFKILSVIDGLRSGGSTAGARGIQDAYRLAEANFNAEGVNRIILATDGDFNVGITNRDDLKGYIERKRKSGVYLSILGFGQGNYNDALMQTLAQNGNGTASYIDTLNEARKVLVDEASSNLFTIAKDVKVQVEFNPKQVQSYRLIGYETRALKREDFNNDRVDAGDVGSGHSVTAIYEITPAGAPSSVDALRYGESKETRTPETGVDGEIGFVKLRYKLPNETASKLITQVVTVAETRPSLDAVSDDVRFSVAVAGFGQLLRGNSALDDFSYDDVAELASGARGPDRFGYRSEFVNLVRLAKTAQP